MCIPPVGFLLTGSIFLTVSWIPLSCICPREHTQPQHDDCWPCDCQLLNHRRTQSGSMSRSDWVSFSFNQIVGHGCQALPSPSQAIRVMCLPWWSWTCSEILQYHSLAWAFQPRASCCCQDDTFQQSQVITLTWSPNHQHTGPCVPSAASSTNNNNKKNKEKEMLIFPIEKKYQTNCTLFKINVNVIHLELWTFSLYLVVCGSTPSSNLWFQLLANVGHGRQQ